ncbi:MAG: pyridoxamine 5'-phosphate oxidase family protein [Bacillus sp. (in: firmicutes)]
MLNKEKYNPEELETLRRLIKDVDVAMLTTKTEEGLVSRPMQTQEVEFDGDLWFFTKKDTEKYQEILHDTDVNVAYAGKSYVSIRGRAEIVNEMDKKRELWNKMYEKLLETSYDDPNVILIKVKAQAAEYWETGSIKKNVVNLYKKMTRNESDPANMNRTVELE